MLKSAVFIIALTAPAWATLNVPLTVQEAIYPGGVNGISRTNEPFCMGVPLADAAGVTSINALGLAGASSAQFRVLGAWPDGHIKWVKVCGIVPSLAAGSTQTVTLQDGSGNFGGANLATDNGDTITVATGAATFTVKKANFNVIDSAVVGGTTVVASSASPTRGLVITGPSSTAAFPGNVTCSPDAGGTACTTVYSSANDAASTCLIEENGPVAAVLKCTGTHYDSTGHAYMHFTARETFYQGKTGVKATVVLRNADYDTLHTRSNDAGGNTFNTAYKAIKSYELRIAPNITGSLQYSFGSYSSDGNCGGGVCTGSLNQSGATDNVQLYQGQSQFMTNGYCGYQSPCANMDTTQTGFSITRNGAAQTSGTSAQYPQGWADISDASGRGMEIGVYELAAYWPKSLEFDAGGADSRIGIYPSENSQITYQAWPAWHIDDLYLNFHAAPLASAANEFLKFQHYLLARPTVSYVNSTAVFPYNIAQPADEDAYLSSLSASASPALSASAFCYGGTTPCLPDDGTTAQLISQNQPLEIQRYWAWSDSAQRNQKETRWSDLQNWIKRGYPGRFLESSQFYRLMAEKVMVHSDGTSAADATVNGFNWRSRPHAGTTGAELDGFGHPSVQCSFINVPFIGGSCPTITNWSKGYIDWMDQLHFHWYGMPDYYFMTGDETVKEAMVPMLDWYLNNDTYQGAQRTAATLGTIRGVAIEILSSARYADYLNAIGDSADASGVLAQGQANYSNIVTPDLCVSGYPAGCAMPPANAYPAGGYDQPGVSKVRGMVWTPNSRGVGWCGDSSGAYRGNDLFQSSLMIEGLLALRRSLGPSWPDYEKALDLSYGISSWALYESFWSNGSNLWFDTPNNGHQGLYNGFQVGVIFDIPQTCNAPGGVGGTAGQSYAHGAPLLQFGGAGPVYDPYGVANADQGMWMLFYPQILVNGSLTTDQIRRFNLALDQVGRYGFPLFPDGGQYQLGTIIDAIDHPPGLQLQDVAFTTQDLGSGNYKLSWTEPLGTQSYRVKWCCAAPYGPKAIANSGGYSSVSPSAPGGLLGFDPQVTQTFTLSPATNMTWFGANPVGAPNEPVPGTSSQSITIATGVTGLAAADFSVKAMISAGGAAPAPATNIQYVSGNGQSGTVGHQLSAPFFVKVTNAAGGPVSGTAVSFSVAAGGGTLTTAQAVTDSQGLASTALTLGSAAGTNTVTATAGGLVGSPVTFTATATAAQATPANLVIVSGGSQSGTPGQALPAPLVVKVTDASGNGVAGVTVSFAVTLGGGSLSQTQVITDSQGNASDILTLGSAAGTNTVTASSATLSGSPAVFTETGASSPGGGAGVTWVRQSASSGWPSFVGWTVPQYDPVSQQTLFYVGPLTAQHGIYATDIYAYNSATNIFTHIGGTGSTGDACPSDAAAQPGDRHPGWQMAVDTRRSMMWLYGGVDQGCNAGTGANGNPRHDMYYLQLTANPASDTWHQLLPAHLPATLTSVASMVYDSDDDVLFVFGYDGGSGSHNNWIYCRTAENVTPGVATALQVAAGCAAPDDWNEVHPVGGVQPPSSYFPGMIYDTATKKVIMYGGGLPNGTTFYNQTWAYDIHAQTWAQKGLGTTAPPVYTGNSTAQPAMAYNPSSHKVLFHQTSNTGAPADWQYDPALDTWVRLSSSGGGVTSADVVAYDSLNNRLVSWSQNSSTGNADVWQGTLSASAAPASPCDLNSDGVVNSTDVQIAINAALGLSACGSGDLVGSGSCNVVDVQRVINASLGQSCRTGQ